MLYSPEPDLLIVAGSHRAKGGPRDNRKKGGLQDARNLIGFPVLLGRSCHGAVVDACEANVQSVHAAAEFERNGLLDHFADGASLGLLLEALRKAG